MPRVAKELGPLEIKNLSASAASGYHAVGHAAGLILQKSPKGSCTWLIRIRVGDKRREIGLGAYPGVTLALAKVRAQEVRDQIKGVSAGTS